MISALNRACIGLSTFFIYFISKDTLKVLLSIYIVAISDIFYGVRNSIPYLTFSS